MEDILTEHSLLQLRWWEGDPWRVVVISMLLNVTSWKQVEPILEELFMLWPTVWDMKEADPDELASVIRPCGLQEARAKRIIQLSSNWCTFDERRPNLQFLRQQEGVGEYVEQAYRVIVLEDISFVPSDEKLRAYTDFKLTSGRGVRRGGRRDD